MLLFLSNGLFMSMRPKNVRRVYCINHMLTCCAINFLLQIKRLIIGHTNEGLRAGWFLDSVQIHVPVHGKNYMFPSNRWLSEGEADGKTEVELYPSEILDMEQCRQHTLIKI